MTKEKAIEIYEQLLTSLKRTEDSKKDIDLLVALRAIYFLIEERVKELCK